MARKPALTKTKVQRIAAACGENEYVAIETEQTIPEIIDHAQQLQRQRRERVREMRRERKQRNQ